MHKKSICCWCYPMHCSHHFLCLFQSLLCIGLVGVCNFSCIYAPCERWADLKSARIEENEEMELEIKWNEMKWHLSWHTNVIVYTWCIDPPSIWIYNCSAKLRSMRTLPKQTIILIADKSLHITWFSLRKYGLSNVDNRPTERPHSENIDYQLHEL